MSSNNKKDKKKKRTKKIILAIVGVVLVGLIFTTATYAWYTANDTVYVKDVDVTITSSSGFSISADANNWKSFIETDELKALYFNQFPTISSPVSTIGEVNDMGRIKFFKGTIVSKYDSTLKKDTYTLTAEKSSETIKKNGSKAVDTGDFVTFDLYFQAGSGGTLYLTEASTVKLNNAEGQYAEGVENAARVAFVVQGYTTYDAYMSVSQALNCKEDNPDGCFTSCVWEPNADYHNTHGKTNAYSNYGLTNITGQVVPYKGIKAEILSPISITSTDSEYFGDVTNLNTSNLIGIVSNNRIPAFKIEAGITKVRVYIWVEGQDVDCEDSAANSTLSVDLGFSLDKSAG